MTLAEKLRFLADRIDDGKEFYIEDRLLKYGGRLLSEQLADIRLLDIFQSTFKLKPRWEFTEDEKAILRNLHDDFQWIARDKDRNKLYVYTSEPTKATNQHWVYIGDVIDFNHFKHLFQSVQWEDDAPCKFRKYL